MPRPSSLSTILSLLTVRKCSYQPSLTTLTLSLTLQITFSCSTTLLHPSCSSPHSSRHSARQCLGSLQSSGNGLVSRSRSQPCRGQFTANFRNRPKLIMLEPHRLRQKLLLKISALPTPLRIRTSVILKYYEKLLPQYSDQLLRERGAQQKQLARGAEMLQPQGDLISGTKPPSLAQLNQIKDIIPPQELDYLQSHPKKVRLEGYWVQAMKNCFILQTQIRAEDQPLLRRLIRLDVVYSPGSQNFTVRFDFDDNDFIDNRILTKTFEVVGGQPESAVGCEVLWKESRSLLRGGRPSFFRLFESRGPEHSKVLQFQFLLFRTIATELFPYSLEYYFGLREQAVEDWEQAQCK